MLFCLLYNDAGSRSGFGNKTGRPNEVCQPLDISKRPSNLYGISTFIMCHKGGGLLRTGYGTRLSRWLRVKEYEQESFVPSPAIDRRITNTAS